MEVVFATETASLQMASGGTVLVRKGSHWKADDPLVLEWPGFFAADPRYGLAWSGNPPPEMSEPPVEQATAAPGERRTVRRA
jgi:hypothetical protein